MISYYKVFVIGLKAIYEWMKADIGDHFAIVLIAIAFIGFIPEKIKDRDLNLRTAYAPGVVTDLISRKHGWKVKYEFYIGDKSYIGWYDYPATKIRIGDSLIVAYEYTNIENNKIYCYFEYVIDRKKLKNTVYANELLYRLDRSKLPDSLFYRRPMNSKRQPWKGYE